MLENENRFLDNEFRRQLDKIVQEKNEQINKLMHIIDQATLEATSLRASINNENRTSGKHRLFSDTGFVYNKNNIKIDDNILMVEK